MVPTLTFGLVRSNFWRAIFSTLLQVDVSSFPCTSGHVRALSQVEVLLPNLWSRFHDLALPLRPLKNGAHDEARTRDLPLTKGVHYHCATWATVQLLHLDHELYRRNIVSSLIANLRTYLVCLQVLHTNLLPLFTKGTDLGGAGFEPAYAYANEFTARLL